MRSYHANMWIAERRFLYLIFEYVPLYVVALSYDVSSAKIALTLTYSLKVSQSKLVKHRYCHLSQKTV